jgi:RNA recognition motif-containing protein
MIKVTNLPRSCSWQDLKDFFRKSGDVVYADVKGRGEGIVQYSNGSDMRHAIRTLDDTEMK